LTWSWLARHARLWPSWQPGVAVGQHDLIIAATALAYGHKVATFDQRSFLQDSRTPAQDVVSAGIARAEVGLASPIRLTV